MQVVAKTVSANSISTGILFTCIYLISCSDMVLITLVVPTLVTQAVGSLLTRYMKTSLVLVMGMGRDRYMKGSKMRETCESEQFKLKLPRMEFQQSSGSEGHVTCHNYM